MSCQVTFPLQDIVLLLRDKINPEIIGAVPEEKLEEEVLLFIQPKIDELQEQLAKLPPEVHIVTQILEGTSLKTTLNNGKVLSSDLSPLFVKFDGLLSLYEKNVAAGAGITGWDASLVVYDKVTQKQINDGFDSIAQLLAVKNPRNGMRVCVKSYNAPNYALNKPFDNGGGTFVYDSTKATINDGGIIINGWVRQDTKQIFVNYFGTKGDGVANDSPAFQKAVDYCEKNQIKTLRIGNGDYLLNDKVYFYRGGVNVIGEGALQREESWADTSIAPYPDMLVGRKGDAFTGCSIIVPKNSTGFVFAKSVVDHVFFSMLQFKSKEGRTVGNTNAIDFFSEFGGPTWGFIITYCHFTGFNKVVNIQSPTQYCVAFVEFSHNSMTANDEVLYFGDLPQEKWDIIGSRNLTWGLTFEHNKCHNNARLIRACVAKDMCRISQNNLEGSIPYADGTHPKYAVDLELYNCFVVFEGNHAEAVSHDILFASTYMRKPDGTRHEFKNNQTALGGSTIEIRGNNYDGIDAQQYHAHTLEGMRVINVDNQPCYLHNCSVVIDSSTNKLSFKNAKMSKTEASVIIYPLNGTENILQLDKNNVTNVNWATIPTSDKTLLLQSPVGQRQVTKFTELAGANIVNYTGVSVPNDAKYLGLSLLVNSSKEHGFFGGCTAFVTYSDGSGSHDITVGAGAAYGLNKGWNIVTSYLPRNLIPADATITSLRLAFDRNGIQGATIFIDIMATTFAINTDDYFIAPYYLANMQVFVKQGTFEKSQMFLDNDGVFNVCKQAGTIGGTITALATGNVGNYYFDTQDAASAKQLSTGQYISIAGTTYRIANIKDARIYTDRKLAENLSNGAITFAAPVLSTVTLT